MIIHSFTYSITEQRVANYSQAGPLPVLVNKTLLEHSHAYSFTHCLWFLPHYSGRVEGSTQRLYGLKSLKYYLDLCRKSFLTPALDEQSLNVLTVRCSGMPASTQLCVRPHPNRLSRPNTIATSGKLLRILPTHIQLFLF